MIYFIGAGPGAPDLITLRGAELLRRAGLIVYAGSLVNPALLDYAPQGCEVYDSALMTLDEVMEKLLDGERRGLTTVRLHTGDPSLYGAIREQMDRLRAEGVEFSVVPGVSSFCAPASARPSSSAAWRAGRPSRRARASALWPPTGPPWCCSCRAPC